jgi:hypothetical protein
MLRSFVLLLLFANGLYFAWTEGWLQIAGFAPSVQTEPQRLAQQIVPESLEILTPKQFQKAQEQARTEKALKECWQVGPFDEVQANALQRTLPNILVANSWKFEVVTVVQNKQSLQQYQLKIPALPSANRPRLNDLTPALAGRTFQPCTPS